MCVNCLLKEGKDVVVVIDEGREFCSVFLSRNYYYIYTTKNIFQTINLEWLLIRQSTASEAG